MMRERFITGYNDFVIPFMAGMIFILVYLLAGIVRTVWRLEPGDRKKLFLSLINPRLLLKDIRDIILDCLLHVKIFRRNILLGYMHASIAFGWFMLIVIGHIEVWLYTPNRLNMLYYPIFFRFFVASHGEQSLRGSLLFFLMDFFLLVVLSGIFLAMFKRIRSQILGMRRTTKPALTDRIAMYALWSIFPLRLLAEGFTAGISGGSFLTKSISLLFGDFFNDPSHLPPIWWAYSCALGVFFVMLPFSRYMHIPTEMFLIVLRNAGVRINHPRKGYAVAQIYSCSSCGICIDACPMGTQKKNLPFTSVYFMRYLRRKNEGKSRFIADKCLMCGKCEAVCPVGVESCTLKVADRAGIGYRFRHEYGYLTAAPASPAATSSAAASGTAGPAAAAQAPAPAAAVQAPADKQEKVLYYQGCMTQLTPAVSRAMEQLLKACGTDYEFLDRDGGICCGRPLELSGKHREARELMERNTEAILATGARTLLVSCPICYRIFTQQYNLPGIRVVHHTAWIREELEAGRLRITPDTERLVYHDPCELGRGCGEYESPRLVLRQAGVLVAAEQERAASVCCGGSVGSLTLSYEDRTHLTDAALRNLTVNRPEKIVTACPLCLKTFSSRSEGIPVQDIAETVAARLDTADRAASTVGKTDPKKRNSGKTGTDRKKNQQTAHMEQSFTPTRYSLMNVATGRRFEDTGWLLSDPQFDGNSLIRAVYEKKQIDVKGPEYGLYRFADWLPVRRMLQGSCAPVTYKSSGLAAALGLDNLYITFSGYWPAIGAKMNTCSFKETEAYSVCARLPEGDDRVLVVASAGNTARAFSQVCSDNNIPLVVCIPEENMDAMWFHKPLNPCVKIICTPLGTDYFDAISLSNIICRSPRFREEGGAKNVARRDGMATTVLSAATHIGRIPDAYFQAVGSGTGTIAAWEANLRLLEDGRFGNHKMKLFPAQNAPFLPMYDAWKARSRELPVIEDNEFRSLALQIKAKVLSNRKPPYGIAGGLFDAMTDAGGDMEQADNRRLKQMCALFEQTEGMDVYSASGVAIAALEDAVREGKVQRSDILMLNITGGGEKHFKATCDVHYPLPDAVFPTDTDPQEIIRRVEAMF